MLRDANPSDFAGIYIVCGRTDMRLGMDSLAAIIENRYHLPLFVPNTLFLFCGRRANKIKGLLLGRRRFSSPYKACGRCSTTDEIMDYFELDPSRIPSQSAFNQRRSKISLSAFEYLFSEFSSSFPTTTNSFKDHCILAFDGCHVVYTTNAEILEDYNKPRLIDYKGYNHMHLNGFVDVISKAFLDVVIQPGQHPDERAAMRDMLDHFHPDEPEKYIITADRGYESYDLIFQCELKKLNYVFRVKSPTSSRSMLSSYLSELPDVQEEFDVEVKRFFTDKYTKIMKEQGDVYHYMNPYKTIPNFQKLLAGNHLHYLRFRVLKIKTAEDTTNISLQIFPTPLTLMTLKIFITGGGE